MYELSTEVSTSSCVAQGRMFHLCYCVFHLCHCVTVCSICVTVSLCVSCGECALFCSLCRFELLVPSPWGTPNGPHPLFIHLTGTGDHVSSVCCVVMRPCVCVCVFVRVFSV